MKALTAKRLIKILVSNGFWLARSKGSHHVYKNTKGTMLSVPLHGKNKPIHIGTYLKILKQSELAEDLFM